MSNRPLQLSLQERGSLFLDPAPQFKQVLDAVNIAQLIGFSLAPVLS